MSEELADRVFRKLVGHEIDDAAAELESSLRTSRLRFGPLADLVFTNDVHCIGQLLNAFYAECEKTTDVKCLLLQHNGFVFNHGLWYFEPQAYDVMLRRNGLISDTDVAKLRHWTWRLESVVEQLLMGNDPLETYPDLLQEGG